jgi:hypothetical protein
MLAHTVNPSLDLICNLQMAIRECDKNWLLQVVHAYCVSVIIVILTYNYDADCYHRLLAYCIALIYWTLPNWKSHLSANSNSIWQPQP